jgi:hypothetical protein
MEECRFQSRVTEVGEEVVVEKRDRAKDMRRVSDGELEREGRSDRLSKIDSSVGM